MFAALRRRRKRSRARARTRNAAGLRRRPCLECLEDRIVPAYSLFRPEFLVNPPAQPPGVVGQPPPVAVASDCDGNFVVAWASERGLGDTFDVFAQRYNQNGAARGGVITVAAGVRANVEVDFITVDVAMNSAGAFVVAYDFDGQPVSQIRVHRYAANGTSLGPTIVLSGDNSSGKPLEVLDPSVALADNGIAYVAYVSSIDAAELGGHIFVQRVGVAPIGLPQQVSTNQTRQVSGPSIACTAAGGSVVTWTALGADFRPNVVARRVSAAGLPVGPAPFVVSKDATFRTEPGVGVERDDGRFVIAWNVADDLGPRILAQRFSAGGAFLGSSFQVNTDKPENVNGPDVGVDDEGEFVIGWTTGRFSTVFFRAFDVTGTPEADQVKVNPLTRDFGPSDIAVDCCGDLVMAWSGVGLPAAGKAQIIATMYSVPECKDEVERPDPEVPDIVPTPPTAPALSSDLDPGVLIALANEEDARLVRFLLPEEPEERMFFPSLTVQGEPPSTFPELVAARGVGSQPPPIGEISGVVFIDLNGNGIQDPGEVGLAGQLVFLDENDNGLPDELEMQIYTDKNGVYYFGGLALSRYHVRQDLRDLRVEQTVPTQNEPRIVELTLTNFAVSGQNFGSQVEAPAGNNRSGQRPPVRSQPGPVPRTTSPSPAPGGAEPVPGNRSAPEPAPEP